ncbi:MAG: tRNA1(Val) (adenine(37)-N6)-methyltransferase [Bacillota bacterium]|jgi:tRNA1Val (adenine37-N6)-methyltransferase|nr:tRNA1(Val) (adenine(37)-N6)-methyltransferase [Clostridia bacterium]
MLLDEERIDDLLWRNLKIIQNPHWFCFSLDAVLLAGFATLRSDDLVVDLGTGTGVIPLLLSARARNKKTNIIGLEIKPEVADMAQRSVALNKLSDQIFIKVGDIKTANTILGKGKFDLVVSNPPYALVGSGKISPSSVKAAARTEIFCTLEDVVREASLLLNSEGRFAVVHRPQRLVDIFYLMRNYRLEPKRVRFVHPVPEKEPNLILVEGIKNGKKDVQILPPLYVYEKTGIHSKEMKAIFAGKFLSEEW